MAHGREASLQPCASNCNCKQSRRSRAPIAGCVTERILYRMVSTSSSVGAAASGPSTGVSCGSSGCTNSRSNASRSTGNQPCPSNDHTTYSAMSRSRALHSSMASSSSSASGNDFSRSGVFAMASNFLSASSSRRLRDSSPAPSGPNASRSTRSSASKAVSPSIGRSSPSSTGAPSTSSRKGFSSSSCWMRASSSSAGNCKICIAWIICGDCSSR